MSWALPLLVAALVPFQIHVQTNGSLLNVNLADPIAIAGAFVFLTGYVKTRGSGSNWRVIWFETGIAAAMLAIGLGFLNGAASIGITDWALYNRAIGFLILLSYVATGALVVGAAGQVGLRTMLSALVLSCVAIACVDLVIWLARDLGLPGSRVLMTSKKIAGMAQNANAFALQIVLALAATIALAAHGTRWSRVQIPLMATLMVAVLASGSRAGLACALAVLGLATALGVLRPRLCLSVVVASGLLFASIGALPKLPELLDRSQPAATHLAQPAVETPKLWTPQSVVKRSDSNAERWQSIMRGFELWMTSPVLGAGLGTFRHQMQLETGKPLVIHNSLLWLLAELGIVGAMAFLVPFAIACRSAWQERNAGSVANTVLLLTLLVFAVSQLAHDVLYQRIFWLLLGATLFAGRFRYWKQGSVSAAHSRELGAPFTWPQPGPAASAT